MKPIKLKMEAFGSYAKETVIDFTKPSQNLFLITGDTGSGKSTIFDAIVFALYGQAGAADNAKGGLDLQSQYADVSVTPYVELTFSEMRSGEEQEYRVRREPDHMRSNKKQKANAKAVKAAEQVELKRPGDTNPVVSSSQKEVGLINREIEDIVGLTKEQFMQVAMIAQGDFTRLIKADTKERKPIFRKIFNTGIYEKIIDVLTKEYNDLSGNIKTLKNYIKIEVNKIIIPDDYPERASVEACKNKIVSKDNWTTVDMEELLVALKQLCDHLSVKHDEAKESRDKTEDKREEARTKLTEAQALIKSFEQLEEAQKTLAECAKRKEEIEQMEKLQSDIGKAYEISGVYDLLEKAEKALNKHNDDLKKLKEELPKLKESENEAEKEKEQRNDDLSKKKEKFVRVDEAVKKALETFDKIKEAAKEEKECRENEQAAKEEKEKAKNALEDFKEQLKEWEEEQKKLSECGTDLEKVNNELYIIKDAEKYRQDAEKAEKDRDNQKKTLEQVLEDFKKSKELYDIQSCQFITLKRALDDARAGLLAKNLEEGKPCPVCGSISHPAPCQLSAEHKELTQEIVDDEERKAKELGDRQSELSIKVETAKKRLEDMDSGVQEKYENLKNALQNAGIEFTEPLDLKQIKKDIAEKQHDAEERKSALEKDKKRCEELSEHIDNADEKRQELDSKLEEAEKKYNEANGLYIKAQTSCEEAEKQKTYSAEQEAKEALRQAEDLLREAEKQLDTAEKAYSSAKSKREQTETNIKTLEEQTIPEQKTETDEQQDKYSEAMEKSGMAESEWKDIVQHHKNEELEEIEKTVKEYNNTVLTAETTEKTAKAAVEDKQKPDIESLEQEKKRLEEAYEEADRRYQEFSKVSGNNSDVFKELTTRFSEQKNQLLKFNRYDHLRKKLAGKESGEKTDIETIVQRIYLERILGAANKRFLEMSSDQFEFRMMDTAKSTQSDRGLELMVRSTITGKEQEVKMLSGGESFIAALSLALGMSDQIQQNSASVNLDIMFIDEGFGSLDANTRNQAIKVLKNMAGGSKMIGIISHVSELQQQIDDKLAVERDRSGSSAHWIVS